ncbi:MAG TPA: ATP-binding protein [Patescibacteria group bacterium]|nr:ATP-binding protein [Patescibacteria group bacterium]
MDKHNWYALTGGPGSGKTTLLKELKRRGHNTIKESARYYIKKELAKGLSLEKIREDEKAFQEAVFKQKQIIHEALATDAITFFDRGYHDTIAYLKYHEHQIAQFIEEVCKNPIYKKVFVLDMLPYINDEVRTEDYETAKQLHKTLLQTYQESGHEIVRVPVMSVEERADFIEQQINQTASPMETAGADI